MRHSVSFLLAALLGAALLPGLSGCSGTPKRGELQAINATAQTRTLWSARVGASSNYVFTPAVIGNGVWLAGEDGTLAHVDRGQTVWQIQVGQKLSAGVGSDGRMVVVGTPKGEVLAFSALDGKPLWTARVSSEVLAPPVISDVVLVKTADNRLFALNLADGSRKWMYERPSPALAVRNAAPPVVAGPYVIAGFPGGKLVAVDGRTGAQTWEGTVSTPKGATELDRIADIVAAPVIDGRLLCATAFQGRVACFDIGSGGNQLWARDISSAAGLSVDGQHVYITDSRGIVHALDKQNGTSVWKQDRLAWRTVTAPVLVNGRIVVADHEGVVHFLNSMTGAFVARSSTGGNAIATAPQVLGDAVLVQTRKGEAIAIEAQ